MVYVAAAKSERDDADLTFFSAAAKCYASDVAMKVTTDACSCSAAAGFTEDFPLERMMRDAKITQIYEGTNQGEEERGRGEMQGVLRAIPLLDGWGRPLPPNPPRAATATVGAASRSRMPPSPAGSGCHRWHP